MADEEFEIDVYGDEAGDERGADHSHGEYTEHGDMDEHGEQDRNGESHHEGASESYHEHQSMDDAGDHRSPTPQQRPQQGVKRKEGSDDRPVDPGATSALMLSDLNWWNTDDDIRGWVQLANCEGELKDITFSEHKVNGKSKGQAYLEFTSQQAATATRHFIDNLESGQPGQKRHSVIYTSPSINPFRTLPKDAPNRAGKDGQGRAPSGPGFQDRNNNFQNNNYNGGFRGGRGGYSGPRGGGMNPGGFNNRNFQGNNMSAFNNNMGGFSNPMAGGGFNGGFNRGGGMMGGGMRGGPGMRGGRGGGMGNMMGAGMMNAMPMGGMGGPMGAMGMMGGGMPGFQNMQPQFNPAFFGGGNQPNEWQNPHGAKRARGE